MNEDFPEIRKLLEEYRDQYARKWNSDPQDPRLPITERDIVAEIYSRLQEQFNNTNVYVHSEIKPASSVNAQLIELKSLPRIDIVLLKGRAWFSDAKMLQGRYIRGAIEARFSSIPIEFFHTAIEVKIQSNVGNAIYDIDSLAAIAKNNQGCNCFFVLLNARGRASDHKLIRQYAQEQNVSLVEYTTRSNT